MAEPRIIIVGAGPSGTRAAEACVAAGLRPIVIDEGRRDGGQIYRRQPDNFTRPYRKLYGTEAGRAQALHETFDGLKGAIDYRPETLVWNIAKGHVWTASATVQEAIPFDALLLCTGATDRLMPVKGWQFAGAYSLGGAQVALKSQAVSIGHRVVFMGSGPLLYLVASQYVEAGAEVAAVLDTSPFGARLKALPDLLAMPSVLWNGVALTRTLKRAGVMVQHGVTPVEIMGDAESGVGGVRFFAGSGREETIACDAVAMGHHLRPETQLADLARCAFAFDPGTRQWLPERDDDGRSSVAGVYLAGDGAKILGARSAEASGRLAALGDLGLPVDKGEMTSLRSEVGQYARFARGLAKAFPWPARQAPALPDDAILCRCEGVTAGDLRAVMRETGAQEANRAKAFSRVGMGRCQGRYCGLAAAELIAAEAGVPVEQVGRLRGQAPVKPLPIAIGDGQ
ncbi:NAD(P)/FAD-dependent oxidoreductase [Sphingobium cupriresistens]|uniref:NAD(P)/FAD-dependent oxidoreductase n=1 Tax=Sphingobium cupriresistens TaxID=1132417 RepID=A0A8G1ZK62_9SPHN|nr:FAD/NAD(P)-binding oxidoreductase [Sphingobium cupriresistens]RYM08982.1 NAD(P)/FAD-dependent oxidoreductase [Sphingobium cupriresistens]